ncbi:MAG: flippase-like domain-containing protein [Planctomycetes bacterium]|nr:flippase-like domain-containing protein [Planctomycetota bacterium]
MRSQTKRYLLFLLKFLLAAGLLAVLVRHGLIDLKEFGKVILGGWPWLLVGLFVFLFNLGITAWRWNLLLRAQGIRISNLLALRLTFVGQFFSTFMPGATGGDLVKAYYMWRRGHKRAAAVTTVFLDRVIGIYCMIALSTVMVLVQWDMLWKRPESRSVVLGVPLLFLATTAAFALAFTSPLRRIITATRTGPPIPFGEAIYKIYQATDIYRHHRGTMVLTFLISLASNFTSCVGFWAYGIALGDPKMTGVDYLLTVPLGMVVNGLPIFPMGLGQGESALHWLFEKVAGSTQGAESMVLFHLVVLFWSAVGFFFYLSIRSDVLAATAASEATPPEESGPAVPKAASLSLAEDRLADYAGALHFHTRYSDGSDSMREVIRQGKRCQLDFLVVTDHDTLEAIGDGWQGWHDGVLNIVGVEISARQGHSLALGLRECDGLKNLQPPDYLREVRRRGAFAFVAHPLSKARREFQVDLDAWTYWDCPDFHGLEVWSYMHDWIRDVTFLNLPRYLLNPNRSIRGPEPELLARWDELGRQRRIVGIGGIDNHALNLPWSRFPLYLVKVLPYRFVFQTVRTHVLSEPFTGENEPDVRRVLDALRLGRCYIAYDYLAPASGFRFEGRNGRGPILMGDESPADGRCRLAVQTPAQASLTLFADGKPLASAEGQSLEVVVETPGVYRAEAQLKGQPWIYSNPIYLR